MTKQVSCDRKFKSNSTTCNSNQKWNNETFQGEFKNYQKCKKDCSCKPNTCICENSMHSKSIANTWVIECDEIITVIDIASIKKTNTIAIHATSTASINCHSKKVRDCYILHTVLLGIILLLIITIIYYHYPEEKGINALTI